MDYLTASITEQVESHVQQTLFLLIVVLLRNVVAWISPLVSQVNAQINIILIIVPLDLHRRRTGLSRKHWDRQCYHQDGE